MLRRVLVASAVAALAACATTPPPAPRPEPQGVLTGDPLFPVNCGGKNEAACFELAKTAPALEQRCDEGDALACVDGANAYFALDSFTQRHEVPGLRLVAKGCE